MSKAEKKGFDLQELQEALQNLDFENIGGWPTPIKIGATVLAFVGVIFLGYMLSITAKHDRLASLERQERELMRQYEDKAFKAQHLDQYRGQLVEMEEMFGSLLNQLPKETEVPGLLEDITHTGLGSGLEFSEIELGQEAIREFYAELPITIRARGDFHGFGSFVSGVAALPRIVTLEDFVIEPVGRGGQLLGLTITAKTYRYSTARPAEPAKNNPRGRRK